MTSKRSIFPLLLRKEPFVTLSMGTSGNSPAASLRTVTGLLGDLAAHAGAHNRPFALNRGRAKRVLGWAVALRSRAPRPRGPAWSRWRPRPPPSARRRRTKPHAPPSRARTRARARHD